MVITSHRFTFEFWRAFPAADDAVPAAGSATAARRVAAAAASQPEPDVRDLYFKDYIRHWEAMLADVDLVGFTSLRQAVDVLAVLGGRDSPLKRLLTAVAAETTLAEPPSDQKPGQPGDAESSALSAIRTRLSQFLQGTGADQAAALVVPTAPGGTAVDQRSADLHRLVKADGGPAPIDAVIALLDEVYVQLSSMAGALDRGATALDTAAQQGASGALGKLRLAANRQPPPEATGARCVPTAFAASCRR